eukprot:scaffold115440_cov32-Prasinocladus_malaysianus.AAC.1
MQVPCDGQRSVRAEPNRNVSESTLGVGYLSTKNYRLKLLMLQCHGELKPHAVWSSMSQATKSDLIAPGEVENRSTFHAPEQLSQERLSQKGRGVPSTRYLR